MSGHELFKLVSKKEISLTEMLDVIDDPMFLVDPHDEMTPTLEEWQAFNATARKSLIEQDLLLDAQAALLPLADHEDPDNREARVLKNLLVAAGEEPNPAWVGAA